MAYALALQSSNGRAGGVQSASLICAAYAEFGLHYALGKNRAFIQADLALLHNDAIEALPPESVIIELLIDQPPSESTLERCRALRERRYQLALDHYTGLDDRSRPLLSLLSVIKIDAQPLGEAELAELAGPLVRLPLKLLAKGVSSQQKMQYCRRIGFQLFQGDAFTRNEQIQGRRLSHSQAGLIRLINLVGCEADTIRIEEGFKHEPALAVNLLRIVNSVGFGLAQHITSLRHAITMLGRRQLLRWLQLMLLASTGHFSSPQRSSLLQVAALRGRMMELLVEKHHPNDHLLADQAFIAGIMSMMPTALGMPMQEIIEQIPLEPEVMQALMSLEGRLGRVLALIICFDQEDCVGCDALLGEPQLADLSYTALNICLADSLHWVNSWIF